MSEMESMNLVEDSGDNMVSGLADTFKEAHESNNVLIVTSNSGSVSDIQCRVSTPESFVYSLHASTSGFTRIGEDSLTYLNKDQFYPLQLKYVGTFDSDQTLQQKIFKSLISLQLPPQELKRPQENSASWETWAAQQTVPKRRALTVFAPTHQSNSHRVHQIVSSAANAAEVVWYPVFGALNLKVSVHCLSTDFCCQKGVKGTPLRLQIDTYEKNQLIDRAYARVKTFSEKGADRKSKDEMRRLAERPLPYPCQQSLPTTLFVHEEINSGNRPTLYQHGVHSNMTEAEMRPTPPSVTLSFPTTVSMKTPLAASTSGGQSSAPGDSNFYQTGSCNREKRNSGKRFSSNPLAPISLHVRQEGEEAFTTLVLPYPDLESLTFAISDQYQIEVNNIRYVYKRTTSGAVIFVDTDYVISFDRSFYIMKVLVVEGSGARLVESGSFILNSSTSSSLSYDIVLCEPNNLPQLPQNLRFAETN